MPTNATLERLKITKDLIHFEPQTPAREMELELLELQIRLTEAEATAAVDKLVRFLLHTWKQTGSFTVIRQGGTRLQADPHVTGNPIQDIRNVISEAYKLARWSLE